MSNEAVKNKEEVAGINNRFMSGKISRQEAIAELQPIADRVNAKSKEIAKKYNMKAKTVKPDVTLSHGAKLY